MSSNSAVSRRQKFLSPRMDSAPVDGVPAKNFPPHSYLFFIVAKVGPGESHRPVAVALRQGDLGVQFGIQGHQVTRYCLQTVNVLSDPGNRIAIRAELDLAANFYKNCTGEVLLPRVRLPELNRWASSPELDSKWIRGWDTSLAPFPFIATCLQVGIGYNPADGSENGVRKEPLGTFFYDNTLAYGMVVIDISDLEDICYGIIGFAVRHAQRVFGSAKPRGFPPFVEEHRPRRPLSAIEYMSKFYPQTSGDSLPFGEVVNRLQEHPLITVSAMDFIWPANASEDVIAATNAPPQLISGKTPPSEEAITSLLENIFTTQSIDISLIDELRPFPDFQVTLCRHLRERLEKKTFLQPKILGQLLGIACDAQQHLDWVSLKGLPTDAIATALEMPELKMANSIGLCIDTIHGTHKQLFKALSLSTSLRELYLLQKPSRETDNASTELFLELLSTSHLNLHRYKIVLTGLFSSSLGKKIWLPTTDFKLNIQAFPIEHMFVRHQITGSGPTNAIFSPNHFYLGDALLRPERFAAGFLQYLRSLITGDSEMETRLYSLACAPSTLTDMSSKEVSPIPGENFTIPVRPMKREIEQMLMSGLPRERRHDDLLPECWPRVRDLVSGSWVVLVSKDQYRDLEGIGTRDRNIFPWPSTRASFIRYAFVRLKTQISVEDVPENLWPEMVEVGGLKEFLQATAPEVDQNLVDQRLKELEAYISTAPEQIPLGSGLEWLSVLEPNDACVVLKDFLEDAAYVNENLRLAMEDDPEGRNWYPGLLQGDRQDNVDRSGSGRREYARNAKVFITFA